MDYQEAKELADRRQADLAPYCERIEIAGSVRRLKQTDIKDVEIVCVAKTEAIKDMFGIETGKVSLIENIFPELLKSWSAITLRNGTKWKTCVFPGGGKLDLFIVTTDTWGTNLAIKTGPADYSKWLVTKKREGGASNQYKTIQEADTFVISKVGDAGISIDVSRVIEVDWLGGRAEAGQRALRTQHAGQKGELHILMTRREYTENAKRLSALYALNFDVQVKG